MVVEDSESSGSVVHDVTSLAHSRKHRQKLEVYSEVLRRLQESGNVEVVQAGFREELLAHFNRLPTRYAMDVNVERAEDVLMHKRLLHMAHDPSNRPAIDVRIVQVYSIFDEDFTEDLKCDSSKHAAQRRGMHPRPAFGSSANFEGLAPEGGKSHEQVEDRFVHANAYFCRLMHEITFSTDDKPKRLSQLISLLAEIGLNIQEAHAFSTVDGYSLDVFLVDGWPCEETQHLRIALNTEVSKIQGIQGEDRSKDSKHQIIYHIGDKQDLEPNPGLDYLTIPSDGTDVWEIDHKHLKFEKIVASGTYGDLYKGTYHSQEVAIKILKPEHVTVEMQREFAQEVFIMRKVRHKNVVQFIGACTKPPNLCIVTEYMSGGSLYDYLHKQNGVFKLPSLVKVAIDISKGMNYLHQNDIIHRDLKGPNLLMDENGLIKVADFGVARVKAQSGVMTAETGTYRWMAPEVIEHKPYDHKADVFSFGIVLWELLTGKLPYEFLTPLQAAVGVVQKGLRPTIPKQTHAKLTELLEQCWQQDPAMRPDFSEIMFILQKIAIEVGNGGEERVKEKSAGRFFSALRRGHY